MEKKQVSEELFDIVESAEEITASVMEKDAESLHSELETPAEITPPQYKSTESSTSTR